LKKNKRNVFSAGYKFPILGGRLLKEILSYDRRNPRFVSNPWREAIEAPPKD